MFTSVKKRKDGFSIIELMVVISIIIILLGIVMASIMEARKKSRDERRVSDVSNIALAMTLYKEKNRGYPVYPNGIELGKGGELDDDITLFNGNKYNDPLHDEGTNGYGYWYYSNVLCGGQRVNVVLAKSVERSGTSNYAELCSGGALLPLETGLIPRAYAQASCPVTIVGGSTSVNRPTSGTKQIRYGWPNINTADIAVIDPNGIPYTAYNRQSTEPYTFTPTSPIGTYTINVYADINTPSSLCGTLQVNLIDPSAACAVLSPTTLRLNQNGSLTESTSVTWGVGGQAQIDLIYPNGTSRRQWDRNSSPSAVPASQGHISPIMQPGTYSVSVRPEATGEQCSLPLTVLPAETQCNDGVDNDDAEDSLIDMADPGCTSSTDDSEVNVVAPPEYLQNSYYSQGSYAAQPQNYTAAAYVVFIN
jgi:type II secretory pathway pseudopilin PulG